MFGLIQRRMHLSSLWTNAFRCFAFDYKIPHKKTNVFDKYHYNPDHISAEDVYNFKRKPRLAEWDKENSDYQVSIRPPTKNIGKTLILELEKEERDKILDERIFKVPEFRAGDLVEVSMYSSLSEKKYNTFKGIVTGIYMKQSLMHKFTLVGYYGGIIVKLGVRVNSPMVAKITLIKYGSNKNRSKLDHVWREEWSKAKLQQPIIKGRGYTPRGKKGKEKRRNILGAYDDPLGLKSQKKDTVKSRSMVIEE